MAEELQELVVADAAELRAWLAANHQRSPGVWLALTRKGGTTTTLTWQQAVDEALCAGWIDGQTRKRDEQTSSIRFTPRRSRSMWSRCSSPAFSSCSRLAIAAAISATLAPTEIISGVQGCNGASVTVSPRATRPAKS